MLIELLYLEVVAVLEVDWRGLDSGKEADEDSCGALAEHVYAGGLL